MRRENEISFCFANHPQNASQAREIREFQVYRIDKGNEFKEEEDSLAGAPVETAPLIPCTEGKQSGNGAFREGVLNFIWGNPFGEKQV
jgi:hypothetical protein